MLKTPRRQKIVMLLLTFLFPPVTQPQDLLKILPKNYRSIFENEFVRVVRVTYAPHEKLPVHNHSEHPTVYVYLTDSGPVRFSHMEQPAFTLIRPTEKAGTFRVSPGRLEKHEVENLGAIPTEFLRVELKQIPLGLQHSSFRGVRSFNLTHSGVSNEFSNSVMQIQRMIAAGHDAIEGSDLDSPSLLIAFSRTAIQLLQPSANVSHVLEREEVLWTEAHQRILISRPDGASAAHVLRIIFSSGL